MRRILPVFFSFWIGFPANAWEDARVLQFISQTNPVLLSQRQVSVHYAIPTTLDTLMEHTTVTGKVGAGGTDFRDDPYTVYGGIQFNIPLSSRKEQKELATKKVSEEKAIASLHSSVMNDMSKLRSLESEMEASRVRKTFYQEKAAWIKQRIDNGYASDMDKLWTLGEKVNTEEALQAKNSLQIASQQHKLARYAGAHWQTLLAYLQGNDDALEQLAGIY